MKTPTASGTIYAHSHDRLSGSRACNSDWNTLFGCRSKKSHYLIRGNKGLVGITRKPRGIGEVLRRNAAHANFIVSL
jgi:hypothetical protein